MINRLNELFIEFIKPIYQHYLLKFGFPKPKLTNPIEELFLFLKIP